MGSGRDCVPGSYLDHLFIIGKKYRERGLQITSGPVLSPNFYLGLFPLDIDSVDFCLWVTDFTLCFTHSWISVYTQY